MIQDTLLQFGLTSVQAQVYALLLEHGPLKAGELAKKSAIKRSSVYYILEELTAMSLVEKQSGESKPDIFVPKHPENLRSHVEERLRKARDAEVIFSSHIGELTSQFVLTTGKPGVRSYDGLEGLKLVYKEINEKYDHFRLIRSFYDHADNEITDIVERQIRHQVEQDIESQVLTHITPQAIKYALDYRDNKTTVNPHFITDEKFQLPAQIAIYGNKVAITDFPSMLITTIIENKAIKDTFEALFDLLWRKSDKNHDAILEKYTPKPKLNMSNPNFK